MSGFKVECKGMEKKKSGMVDSDQTTPHAAFVHYEWTNYDNMTGQKGVNILPELDGNHCIL